ncbi:MAG: aminotransferase class V-fold PLP-dependent enzyme, partial [Bacteroidetes bacterium]|nr:aminotransferase class V-fold PLP-dependent enzyme [Bacteroidota bacterium]
MTSRREFLKRAGAVGGLAALPLLSEGNNLMPGSDPTSPSFTPEEIRRSLLVPPGRIYLNTGSLGPMPKPLLDNIFALMQQLEQNPVSENWGPLGTRMEEVRGIVAEFIHAEKDEIILTRNTTEGLELVCQSLRLGAGDEILTTTLEHGGGEVGLEFLEKIQGAVVRKVELPLPP